MRSAASARRVCSAPASASEYTAITRMPSRCAVRVMRQAISPRLAISSVLNMRARRALVSFLKELAPNQHPTHLARAGADLVEFGVAQQASSGVVIDIAIAAECLNRVEGALRRAFTCKEDAGSGVKTRRAPGIAGA